MQGVYLCISQIIQTTCILIILETAAGEMMRPDAYMSVCLWTDCCGQQDAVRKLYRCVAEIKMMTDVEDAHDLV